MRFPLRSAFLMGPVLGLGLLSACGRGGDTTTDRASSGSISVTLVDGPAPTYKAINLNVQSVQVHTSSNPGESGWITLASPAKTVDLLKLTGGVVEALAAGRTLDPGQYQMLRLVLGATGNTLTLPDASVVPLSIPSGQQTGLKMPLSFTVAAGSTADIWIDFDGAHSIHLTGAGGPNPTYVLHPVVQAFEKAVTGGVSGTLVASGGPLANVQVYAEQVDAGGNVTLLRTALTNASGAYSLGLLPLNQALYVVSQPVVGATAYDPQSSAAITLSPAAPVATWNGNGPFAANASVGGANGTLTPTATASQSDTVLLLRSLTTGAAGTALLAVATANGAVGSTETFAFTQVPAGSYRVQGLRSTLNGDGSTTMVRSALSPAFSVNNGASTPQNLGF